MLKLFRLYSNDKHTLGILVAGGKKVCYVLEPPWLKNKSNVSCIPRGDYSLSYLERSASGKYKDVYLLENVEDRFGILIHKGNIVSDTMGCLIPGRRVGTLRGQLAVLDSRGAMSDIHSILKREEGFLVIR